MKNIYIKVHIPERDDTAEINADDHPEAVHAIINEQREERQRHAQGLKESKQRLVEARNEFDELISTTRDPSVLEQAIIDVKTLIRFYEEYNETSLKEGIESLRFVVEKGVARTKILISSRPQEPRKRPRLKSKFSDERLLKVFDTLVKKLQITKAEPEQWLFWFCRKPLVDRAEKIEWIGFLQTLTDVMVQLCGDKKDRRAIFDAFTHSDMKEAADIPKPQTKKYQNSPIYKAINKTS